MREPTRTPSHFSRTRSAFYPTFSNPFIFAAIVIIILLQVNALTFPPLMEVLSTVVPTVEDWIAALFCFMLPIAIIEVTKLTSRLGRSADIVEEMAS